MRLRFRVNGHRRIGPTAPFVSLPGLYAPQQAVSLPKHRVGADEEVGRPLDRGEKSRANK